MQQDSNNLWPCLDEFWKPTGEKFYLYFPVGASLTITNQDPKSWNLSTSGILRTINREAEDLFAVFDIVVSKTNLISSVSYQTWAADTERIIKTLQEFNRGDWKPYTDADSETIKHYESIFYNIIF